MGRKSQLVQKFDIIIIGAGASGLMLASCLKDKNLAIIESNPKIAQKIKISGGGRCNVTNANLGSQNYLGDQAFVQRVLSSFDQHKLLSFLKKRGCEPTLQKKDQYFCKKSEEIINIFEKEIKNIQIFLNQKVQKVIKKDKFFIETNKETFEAKKVIVASGGLSYPIIGASSIAYDIAESFGHSVKKTTPALVGFTLQAEQFWMKELSGISMNVEIKVESKKFHQDLLFAHKGISGPAVLNSSVYWHKGSIEIDFLPGDNLNKYLKNSKKLLSTALPLPKRFIKKFLEHIILEDKPIQKLSEKEIKKLSQLKQYVFAPAGNFGYSKAEVTRGGICTDDIDPDTLMSTLVDDLYFIGECLNVTGELGGYNFQWAFSCAKRLKI